VYEIVQVEQQRYPYLSRQLSAAATTKLLFNN